MSNDSSDVRASQSPPTGWPSMEPTKELIDAILDGRCVAFVGAGFSGPAALPGWTDLLRTLAGVADEETRHEVEHLLKLQGGEPLEMAAQILRKRLDERFDEVVRQALDKPTNPNMDERLKWLHGIPFKAILTTNFDNVLQGNPPARESYHSVLRGSRGGWWDEGHWGEHQKTPVIKLHGDVNTGRFIFSHMDYRSRLYDSASYLTFLRSVLSTQTLLFLGFSFNDQYMNELRSEVLSMIGHEHPIAYAVLDGRPDHVIKFFREYGGLRAFSYDNKAGHEPFNYFLKRLYEETNPKAYLGKLLKDCRVLWMDPNEPNNDHAVSFLDAAIIEKVKTPDEALARLCAGREECKDFSMVITHWGKPANGERPPGERLLRAVRTEGIECPVIVFTGEENDERRKLALRLGAFEYVTKFGALFQEIERLFSGRGRGGSIT